MKNVLLQVIAEEKESIRNMAAAGNKENLVSQWIGGSDQSISDIAYKLQDQGLLTEKDIEEIESALNTYSQSLQDGLAEFRKQGEYYGGFYEEV